MKSKRTKLFLLVVAVAVGALVVPLVIRGAVRCHALLKFLRLAEVRERVAVQPRNRKLTALAPIRPVNLGYATFDTGSTNPVTVESAARVAALFVTNGDVRILFFPPFSLNRSTNRISDLTATSPHEARTHPRTTDYLRKAETNQLAAEMIMEETKMLPLTKILFMSGDDFLLYSILLGQKGCITWGSDEVQFFEAPNAKGIVRIGKRAKDRRFASVFLASPDGSKAVGFQIEPDPSSTVDIVAPLDPILRSFRFTAERVDDREGIKALIRAVGIQRRPENQESVANESQPTRPETNSTSPSVDSRH